MAKGSPVLPPPSAQINNSVKSAEAAGASSFSAGSHNSSVGASRYDFSAVKSQIVGHEGSRTKVYLDTLYIPHIGYGSNISTKPRFTELDFYVDGTNRHLTAAEKGELYQKVFAFAAKAKAENNPMVRWMATNTISGSAVVLSDGTEIGSISATQDSITKQFDWHLEYIYSDLGRKFSCFGQFPSGPKNAMIEMQYALGEGGFSEPRRPVLFQAIRNQDWSAAANNANISSESKANNDWRREQFKNGVGAQKDC